MQDRGGRALLIAGCGSDAGTGKASKLGAGQGSGGPSSGAASGPGKGLPGGGQQPGQPNARGNLPAQLGQPVVVADDAGHQLLRLTIDSITPDYACPSDPATQQKPAHGYFLGVGVRLRPCWPIPLDGDTEVATRKAMCGYGTFPPGERATSAHRPACSALARYCSGAGRRIDQQDRLQAQTGLAAFENPYIDFTPLTNNGRFTIIGRDGATETVDGTGPEAVLCSKDGNGLIYQEVKPGETYQGIVVLDTANTSGTLVWQPVLALGAPRAGWEWTY